MTGIGGANKNRFAVFLLTIVLIDRHWWDLNKKPFRRIFANNNKYGMHWWTLTKNRFDNFLPMKILVDLHWWDLSTKPFRRFSANNITFGYAFVGT